MDSVKSHTEVGFYTQKHISFMPTDMMLQRLPISFWDIYGGPIEVAGPPVLISIQTLASLFHIMSLVSVRNSKISGKYSTEGRNNISSTMNPES